MRNIRKILALLLALFLTAALCGCAASRMDDGLAGTSGSDSVKPADATDFMSYAGPIFPLTLAGRSCWTVRLMQRSTGPPLP